jgi:hypothetical protein
LIPQAELEAEKERLTQKHQEELRSNQQKINQLLGQLRKEQNKAKEENSKIRSLMKSIGDEPPSSKAEVVYSKEYVDELKQTLSQLQSGKPVTLVQQPDAVNYQTEETSARFNVLQMKYNQSLNRVRELEKLVNQRNSFKPENSEIVEQYLKEIDALREKIRFYEHQEIPKLTKRVTDAEEKLTQMQKIEGVKYPYDSSEDESELLHQQIKDLQRSENEYKARCSDLSTMLGSIRKEYEEKIKKIKILAITKVKQVIQNILMFKNELNHISSNLKFFGAMVWGGSDKVFLIFFLILATDFLDIQLFGGS